MATLFILILSIINMDVAYFMKYAGINGFQTQPKAGSGQEKAMQQALQLVTDNLKLISFIYIPIQAFASRYIFFRNQNLNFLEHMVLPFYLQGHIYWVSIASAIVLKIYGSGFINYPMLIIAFIYVPFGYMNMFQNQSKVKAFAKGFGVYVAGQLLFGLIVTIVAIIVVATNPEFYDLVKPSNNR